MIKPIEIIDFFFNVDILMSKYYNNYNNNYKLFKRIIINYDIELEKIKLLNQQILFNDFFLNFEKQMLNYILIFKQIINIKIKNNILKLIHNNRKKNFNYIKEYI
jgi:hypothetical protein